MEIKNFEEIKKKINFLEYLKKDGWEIKKNKCTPNSRFQVVKKGKRTLLVFYPSNNYSYMIAKELPDGKAFNLIQYCNSQGITYPEISSKLMKWKSPIQFNKTSKQFATKQTKKNFKWIENYPSYADIECPETDKYFLEKRKLKKEIFKHKKLQNIYFNDLYKNLMVPHYDNNDEIITLEYVGRKGVFFPKNTQKSIYTTNIFENDKFIVITESIIDLISFFCFFPYILDVCIGVDITGNPSLLGKEKLKKLFSQHREKEIVLGLDNDDAGNKLKQLILKLIKETDEENKNFFQRKITELPLLKGKDINEMLVNNQKLQFDLF